MAWLGQLGPNHTPQRRRSAYTAAMVKLASMINPKMLIVKQAKTVLMAA
jgi:hypothetical protein